MEEASPKPLESASPPKIRGGAAWQGLWFVAHGVAIYVIVNTVTLRLAAWTYQTLLPALQIPNNSSRFQYAFSHLFIFSFVPALAAGFTNLEFRQRIAQYVWVVPAAILAYKLVTFSTPQSVLVANSASPFHEYFGSDFLIPEYYDWHEFWQIAGSNADMARGMTQFHFTAPFYAGIGYSLGAWISLRESVRRKVSEMAARQRANRFGGRGQG